MNYMCLRLGSLVRKKRTGSFLTNEIGHNWLGRAAGGCAHPDL